MKRYLQNVLLCAVALWALFSCSPDSEYIKEDTTFTVSIEKQLPNMLQFKIVPADYRIYYAVQCIAKDSLDKWQLSDMDIMNKVIAGLREDYDFVRKSIGWDKTPYSCTFADHSLYYASSKSQFSDLESGEDYRLLVFCVNPDTGTPIGKLHYWDYRTMALSDCPDSDLNVKFMVKTAGDELRIYFKPLDSAGKINKDYYVTGVIISLDSLQKKYGGDIKNYVNEELDYMLCNKLSSLYMYSDIREDWYPDFAQMFEIGKTYVVWACPYSVDYEDNISTLTFKLEKSMYIDYVNDADLKKDR